MTYDYGNTDFRTPAQQLADHQLAVRQNNTANAMRMADIDSAWNHAEGLAMKAAVNRANNYTGGVGRKIYDYSNAPVLHTYAAPQGKILPGTVIADEPPVKTTQQKANVNTGPAVANGAYDYASGKMQGTPKAGGAVSADRQAIMDQQRLLNKQLGTNLKVDGIVGPKTQKAMDIMQARREADLARAVQAEAAVMANTQPATQPEVQAPKQQGWQLDQKATDAQHQAWLNNELGEGQVPTAVYSHPEGLAGWLGGLFGGK